MIYMDNESGFEMLANAIISQAVKDYRQASKMLRKKPDTLHAIRQIREVESFLRSGWFQALTTVDGEYLLRRLKEEVSEYMPKSGKTRKTA